MSKVLKRSAEVLKIENEYQIERLRVSQAYDRMIDEEVERWLAGNRKADDCDFLPEMRSHNKRVIDINRRRDKHLAALKERMLASLRIIQILQQSMS